MPDLTPTFLCELDAARAAGEHVLAAGNLHDFFLSAFDGGHAPLPLPETIALHYERADTPVPVLRFSLGGGLEQVAAPAALQRAPRLPNLPTGNDPVVVFPQLTHVLRQHQCVVVLMYSDFYVPATEGTPGREHAFTIQTVTEWGLDADIRQRGSLVVVVTPENRVHPLVGRLGSGFRTVTVQLPAEPERLTMLEQLDLEASRRENFAGLDPELDRVVIAHEAGGLRLVDLFRLSRERGAAGQHVDRDAVLSRKAAAISEQAMGVLEVHSTAIEHAQYAGLRNVIDHVQGLSVTGARPRGLLLVGPPGTGKSLVVRLIAAILGTNLVSLRNIHEQWVGASERNLERALWILETLAPVVCWIDELDQWLGGQRNTGPSSDGGTSERLLARLMEVMGDHSANRGIVWVGTSNRPDALDAAIEDRFPVTIPLIHPSVEEIADMLPAIAAQQQRTIAPEVDRLAAALTLSEFAPSARTLVQLVERAGVAADARNNSPRSMLTMADLLDSFSDVRDRTDPVEKEFLALTALEKATYRSLFPWNNRPDWTPPFYLNKLLSRDADGHWVLDETGLVTRLDELATIRAQRRWYQ